MPREIPDCELGDNVSISARAVVCSCLDAMYRAQGFATFQRYNNPTEDDVKAVVLANPPKKMLG